jgi:hypothetical protein
MLSVIPFSGFYNSIHDSELDRALEQMFSDESGNPYDGLVSCAFDLVQWQKVHAAYAAHYAAAFCEEFDIVGATFESLASPREYNFETDRIFITLPEPEVSRILTVTPRDILDNVASEMFTSRSGFISHYSPDVDSWGPVAEWDHNQCFALLSAYVLHMRDGEAFDSWAEYSIMEHCSGNGYLDKWLSESAHEGMARLWNVCDYLRTRAERV